MSSMSEWVMPGRGFRIRDRLALQGLHRVALQLSHRLALVARRTIGTALMLTAAGCSVMKPAVRAPEPAPVITAPAVVEAPAPAVTPKPPPPPVAAPRPAPADAVPRVERINEGAPNAPYVIDGQRYVPANDDVPMMQVGLASWYGKPFHGRKTANGEIYDMHRMTAAHKTMPLPSYARVRHRDSGKQIIVRVNDRGPFKTGRVIDLSHAAAKALGIDGLGPVEVTRLTHESIRLGTWRTPDVMAARAGERRAAPSRAAVTLASAD